MRVRKILSLTLAMVLVLGSFTFGFSTTNDETVYAWEDGSGWQNSEINGYEEGELIPIQLVLAEGVTRYKLELEYIKSKNDTDIGFDKFQGWIIAESSNQEIESIQASTEASVTVIEPSQVTEYNGGEERLKYIIEVSGDYAGKSVYGYIHPSVTDGLNLFDGSTITRGSSYWSGSNLQIRYKRDSEQGADKTVSFNIQPGLVITRDFEITKTADKTELDIGEQVTYTIAVTNTGNVDLTGVEIEDANLGYNETESILVGETFTDTISTTYGAVGTYDNTATAYHEDIGTKPAIETVEVFPTYGISVTKIADPTTAKVGDTITYTVTVTNDSDVTLTDIVVDDTMFGTLDTSLTLNAGASKTYPVMTKSAVLGTMTNTVTASSAEGDVSDTATATVEVDPADEPSLAITKVANPDEVYVGETVTYTITVTNDGNIDLTGVQVSDNNLGYTNTVDITAGGVFTDTLSTSYGAVDTYDNTATAYHELVGTESAIEYVDVIDETEETGTIIFNKTVNYFEGKDPNPFNVTLTHYPSEDTTSVAIYDQESVTVSGLQLGEYYWEETVPAGYEGVSNTTGTLWLGVEGSPTTQSIDIVNNKLNENLGSLTVYKEIIGEQVGDDFNFRLYKGDAVSEDPNDIVAQTSVDINNPELIGGLEAGWYTVGEDPEIEGYILPYPITFYLDDGEDASVTLQNIEVPLKITKTVDDDLVRTNENVTYTIVVENTSDEIDLYDVFVEDANLGYSTTLASLTAGGVFTHNITTSYGTEGNKVNTAKASTYFYHPELDNVRDAEGQYIEVQDSANVVVDNPSVNRTYRMTIDKVADGDFYEVGDTIEYTITVENTGNSTLTNVLVTDDMTGLSETIDFLSPGETEEFVTTYVAQESDIGDITNIATAEDDRAGTEDDDVTVTVEGVPEGVPEYTMTIEKTAITKGKISSGDMVEFEIVVTNTGNETITDILVEDDMVDFEAVIDQLEPGESEEFTVKVEAPNVPGPLTNTATATSEETGTLEADDTVFVEEPTPLDVPDTGVAPTDLFFGLGALVSGLGVFFTKKRK